MALIGQMSGSLTHLADGSSYLIAGTNVTITTGTSAQVTIAASSASPAGSNTQVQFNDSDSFGGDSGLVFNKSSNLLTAGGLATTTLGVTGGGSVAALSSSYIVPHSAKNEVLITSGNNVGEATGNDVFLFVTGVVGTQGTTSKGTALFAGDVVASGSLLVGTDVTIGDDLTVGDDALFTSDGAKLSFGADGEVTLLHVHNTGLLLSDDSGIGTTKLMFGDSATFVQQQADGQLGIDADSIINITAPTVDIDASTEVNVSGQATIAGTLLVAADIQHNGDTDTKVSFDTDKVSIAAGGLTGLVMEEGSADTLLLGSAGTQASLYDQVLILSGGAPGSPNESAGGDVVFFVSGAVHGKGSGGTSLFGGDVQMSGTLHASSISGSLTRLADGTSYLIAGSNMTLTTGTSGQVTFAAASTSDPAGSNTQVQFNDGGSLAGDAGLVFNKTTDMLTAGALMTTTLGVGGGGSIAALSSSYIVPASSKNEILITSGNHSDSRATGNDVFLYVTGTVGTQGSTTKGTALFAGDVVASGSLLVGTDVTIGDDLTVGDDALFTSDGAKLSFGADGEVTLLHVHNTGLLLSDDSGVGTTKLMLGDSATFIQQQADGQLGIDADSIINITAPTVDIDASTEVNVSGQATIAGTLLVAADIQHNGDTDTKVSFDTDKVSVAAGGKTGLVMEEGSADTLLLGSAGTQASLYDQVLILSGGAPGSVNEGAGNDVNFYVSGAIHSKNGTVAGTSLFGGDATISGTLHASSISGSLTRLGDGTSYLIAGSNVTITTGTNASVTIAASSGGSVAGSDTQVQFNDGGSFGGDAGLVFNKTSDMLTAGAFAGTTLGITGGGSIAALSSSYIVPASSKNEILITSGNHSDSRATGNDVFLYVTGTVGTQGSTTKGTALFAGDLVTSGTLLATDVTIGDDLTVGDDALFTSDGAKLSFGADAEVTLTHVHNTGLLLSDDSGVGTTKLMFGDAATFVQQQADGQLGIDADSIINITAPTVDIDASTEVNVSGQATIAGTLLVAADIQHNGDTDTKVSFDTDKVSVAAGGKTGLVMEEGSTDVLMLGSAGTQASLYNQVLILSGGAPGSANESAGGDVVFFVSGAMGGKGSAGTSVFGGDVCMSGTLYPSEIKSAKISGSITHLADGTSYLIAGTNMTLTTGTAGQVTFAAASTSDPAGSNTQVQFNDGGSLAGDSGLVFVKGTDTLGVGNVGITTSLSVGGAISGTMLTPGPAGNHVVVTSGSTGYTKTDTFFFVSGSATQAGSAVPSHMQNAVFGGDVVVSGTIRGGQVLGGLNILGLKSSLTLVGAGTVPVASANGGPGSDVSFFVSGSVSDSVHVSRALFGGQVKTSGSILPGVDNTIDLGAASNRWANIYTGDLHLKNDRGDWTIIEESTYLSLRNNQDGKLYRILMEEIS